MQIKLTDEQITKLYKEIDKELASKLDIRTLLLIHKAKILELEQFKERYFNIIKQK
jgi:hypothetical protein